MDNKTIVLPSARAIRHEQFLLSDNSLFLPNYVTMSEFLSKLCIVNEYRAIDDDSRILLLLEASNFQSFSSLKIERNFFTFVKNSSYIFKFFSELSAELYDINELNAADIYGEYEEHISILIELYKRYEQLCNEKKYLDKIFLPKLYTFNEAYIKDMDEVLIHIDGHLTNFELELLEKATAFTNINFLFRTSLFNTKMQEKFSSFGFVLEVDYEYLLNFNKKEILKKSKILTNKNVSCHSFSEALLQVAFVKQKIYEFINKGYQSENIAVILPNEKIAETLKSFDYKANLNFAMGVSYTKSLLYKKLQATLQLIELASVENVARLERVGDELYSMIVSSYYEELEVSYFIALLEKIKDSFSHKIEVKIFEEELYRFEKVLPSMDGMNVKSLLKLFMQRLASRSMDDIRGGKVTVMGVLETRSVSFDAVIILDFDDKNVPKRSDKDMFLNTQVREFAGLPTMSDRENLQKHYYSMLINASKEVALSYVSSTESSASRFLKQLGVLESKSYSEAHLSNILFSKSFHEPFLFEDKTYEHSFKNQRLSATKLKSYLTCKRQYYFRYVEYLKRHDIPSDTPQEYEIGNVVHDALKELYSKQDHYLDAALLKKDLYIELEKASRSSELDMYLIALQKRKLEQFCELEVQRFKEGWKVYKVEHKMELFIDGLTLEGHIDRVDVRDDVYEVLDYKTGKYPLYSKNSFMDAKDFQMEFYFLLMSRVGSVTGCGFYDLNESKIVQERFLQEKLEVLTAHIKELSAIEELDTQMCEDSSSCLFCEYKLLCQRD
jgi:RecB family exonuclease